HTTLFRSLRVGKYLAQKVEVGGLEDQRIDENVLSVRRELDEADAALVGVEAVCLGIDSQPRAAAQQLRQAVKRVACFNHERRGQLGFVCAGGVRWSLCHKPVLARSEEHTSELQSRENLVC